MIRLDVAKRSIDLLVDEAELKKRHAALKPAATREWAQRGYGWLFNETILQADEGCDFDFMRARARVAASSLRGAPAMKRSSFSSRRCFAPGNDGGSAISQLRYALV